MLENLHSHSKRKEKDPTSVYHTKMEFSKFCSVTISCAFLHDDANKFLVSLYNPFAENIHAIKFREVVSG